MYKKGNDLHLGTILYMYVHLRKTKEHYGILGIL